MYYVIRDGDGGKTLFLVDREKTRKFWWTCTFGLALEIHSREAAKKIARNLKYGNPTVIDRKEAINEVNRNKEIIADDLRNLDNDLYTYDDPPPHLGGRDNPHETSCDKPRSLQQDQQAISAIEGALRIKDIWLPPVDIVDKEHEDENKALWEMYHTFLNVTQKQHH